MKKLLIASIFIFSPIIQSMDNNSTKSMTIKTIDDVPAQCLAMTAKLYQQKEKKYSCSAIGKSKILLINDWNACKILEILNNRAANSSDGIPFITSFGQGIYKLYSKKFLSKAKNMGNGIQLYNKINMPKLDTLTPAYKNIIADLQSGWKKGEVSSIKEKRRIELVANGEWVEFTKESAWANEEETLIKHLANTMKLGDSVIGSKPSDLMGKKSDTCCIYIKKDSLKEFGKKFNFDPEKRYHAMLTFKNGTNLPREIAKEITLFAYPHKQ